jgi:hypothetical protein
MAAIVPGKAALRHKGKKMRPLGLSVIGVFLGMGLIGISQADELPVLIPSPQEMVWTSGAEAWLAIDALEGLSLPEDFPEGNRVAERLSSKLGRTLSVSADGHLRILRERLPETIPARTRHEAYHLTVDADAVILRAETLQGIQHGVVSLMALMDAKKGFPQVTITDWPDRALRGVYANYAQIIEQFDRFVDLKFNLIVLEDDRIFDAVIPEEILQLSKRCREQHIDLVPLLQSLGWGHWVLTHEPRAVEARWIEQKPFQVRDGRIDVASPPLAPQAPVENHDFERGDLSGWSAWFYDGVWRLATPEEAAVVSRPGDPSQYALQLTSRRTSSVRVHQDIEVQPNTRYELRADLMTEDISKQGALVEVYGLVDGVLSPQAIGPPSFVVGTTDWHESKAVFSTELPEPSLFAGHSEAGKPYEKVRIFLRIEQCTGSAWFRGVEVRPLPAPHPLAHVVKTPSAPIRVESADGKISYKEGIHYSLEVPELKYPFEQGEPMKVFFTGDSGVRDGDTVLLSFHQAKEGDISCCPSEPLYRQFMKRAIENVVERLAPKYLHIGHDEPRILNRDQRCAERGLSNAELLADDIIRMREYALGADPKIRVMLWDDAINPYQNAPFLDTAQVAELLPRDLMINVWWYDNDQWEPQMDRSLDYFLELGFEVTGSPWFRVPNAHHWAKLFNDAGDNPKALGIIYTTWFGDGTDWDALEHTAEHSWSFGKPDYIPE